MAGRNVDLAESLRGIWLRGSAGGWSFYRSNSKADRQQKTWDRKTPREFLKEILAPGFLGH